MERWEPEMIKLSMIINWSNTVLKRLNLINVIIFMCKLFQRMSDKWGKMKLKLNYNLIIIKKLKSNLIYYRIINIYDSVNTIIFSLSLSLYTYICVPSIVSIINHVFINQMNIHEYLSTIFNQFKNK